MSIITGQGDPYPAGQCTFGAVEFYHDATGKWLPSNLGNAEDWAVNAAKDGWLVSDTPSVPSVIVLGPDVQQASGLGHVGVVERVNSDGSVTAKNLNWGIDPTTPADVKFFPGSGVSFISYPSTSSPGGEKQSNGTGTSMGAEAPIGPEKMFQSIAIFSIAIVLLIAGIMLLFKKQIEAGVNTAKLAAEVAA